MRYVVPLSLILAALGLYGRVTFTERRPQQMGPSRLQTLDVVLPDQESVEKPSLSGASSQGPIWLDPKAPLSERLKAWEELTAALPDSQGLLTDWIVSPNPHPPERELLWRREESLRVMALQSLETALLNGTIQSVEIRKIAAQAASATVRQVARDILAAASQGQSYSQMMEKSLVAEGVPK